MHLGLDLDNTIVNYDFAFYAAGRERNLIPAETPQSKVGVKTYLCSIGREEDWTELQGFVYGPGIRHANLFPAFERFLGRAVDRGWRVTIISHKTRYPYRGPRYDLHASAAQWLGEQGVTQKVSNIYFETDQESKLKRIAYQEVDCFVDDLPEVLGHDQFPAKTRPILFDPGHRHRDEPHPRLSSWDDPWDILDS